MAQPSSNTRSGESYRMSTPPASPLLALPAELRNEIHSYVLGGKAIHVKIPDYPKYERIHGAIHPIGTHKPSKRTKSIPCFLALLKTCRQIQAEARILQFELNNFYYSSYGNAFVVWAETEKRVGVIWTVVLLAYRPYKPVAKQNLVSSMAALTGVTEVEVMAGDADEACWKFDLGQIFWETARIPRASLEDRTAIRDA